MEQPGSEIIIYQNPDGNIKIDVRLEEETVWLTQAQMALLFGKDKRTISEHIGNIFKEGELVKKVVVRKLRTTTQHGTMAGFKKRKIGNSDFPFQLKIWNFRTTVKTNLSEIPTGCIIMCF